MVENKSSLFGIIAIIIGASGLGLGAFSVVNFQTVEGPQGIPGNDGQDGVDGEDGSDLTGAIKVGILNPDQGETLSGNVMVRALIFGSENYTSKVLINASLNATEVPFMWNTSKVVDGWWNISVIVNDTLTYNVSQDSVLVYVDNIPTIIPRTRVYLNESYVLPAQSWVPFNYTHKNFDTGENFNLTTDNYTVSLEGYYHIYAQAVLSSIGAGHYIWIVVKVNLINICTHRVVGGYVSTSDTRWLNAGDVISIWVYVNDPVPRSLYTYNRDWYNYLTVNYMQS